MVGGGRWATSTVSRTGIGIRAVTPDSAASRPRSSSTGGCRPRIRLRSSASAALVSSCASAITRLACAASAPAVARAMPSRIASETSRCWVPSCRSRSRRRRSASAASTTPARGSRSAARPGAATPPRGSGPAAPGRPGRRPLPPRRSATGRRAGARSRRASGTRPAGHRATGRMCGGDDSPFRSRLPGGSVHAVGVHQRVQHTRQPHYERRDGRHGQRRPGQEVVARLLPGCPGTGRGGDAPRGQPVRYGRPGPVSPPRPWPAAAGAGSR